MTRDRWILIANAAEARLFAVTGSDAWRLVTTLEHPLSAAKTSDIMSDRAGRVQQRTGPQRSAADPHTTPKGIEADHFARELASLLDVERARYAQLVLVAPPHFLGLLRSHLSQAVQGALTTCVTHNWTDVPEHELPGRLTQVSA